MKLNPVLLRWVCSAALVSALSSQPLAAATLIMVSDSDLADGAELIVRGRVLELEPAGQDFRSRYLIAVERVLRGAVEAREITVTVLGGEGPEGLGLHVPGAPVFTPGERLLLFLDGSEEGSYQVAHFSLGAFFEASVGDRLLWVRDLEDSHEVAVGPGGHLEVREVEDRLRDAGSFEDWLVDRAQGLRRQADYHLDLGAEEVWRSIPRWSHLGGLKIRWFDFDEGGSVVWRSHGEILGHDGRLSDGGVSELLTAIATWNADAGSDVSFEYGGTTPDQPALCNLPPGEGSVLFENPHKVAMGSFNSSACSGVLAIGGVCYYSSTQPFKGQPFHPAVSGFIVSNQGIGCLFRGSAGTKLAEQLMGHELGHGLALGHSCGDTLSPRCQSSAFLDQALMRGSLHLDSRGSALNCDDRTGLRYLYGALPEEGDPPLAPSDLEARAVSSSRIDLEWARHSSDEDGFVVEMSGFGGFQEVGKVAAGVTAATVTELQAGTTYSFRVRSFKCSSSSSAAGPVSVGTFGGASGSPPAPPSGLEAVAQSSTSILLSWEGNSHDQTHFEIQRSSGGGFSRLANVAAGTTSFLATGLAPTTPYIFRVRAHNGFGASGFSNQASAATPAEGPCSPGPSRLCLNGNRFSVEVTWSDFAGNTGVGRAMPLTPDTGTFWFFHPDNVELVLKILDGTAINGNFWVFYGALSNVEYTIQVIDFETGVERTYLNPAHTFASRGDTAAFPSGGGSSSVSRPLAPLGTASSGLPAPGIQAGAGSGCVPGPRALCLQQGRFQVEVDWALQDGTTGVGKAVALTADTGYFWFFNQDNVEMVVKALDGRAFNDRFWLFYGALSNVEYTMTVTDTVTGAVKTYHNPAGSFASYGDTTAFGG